VGTAIIGSVEELAASERTRTLVKDQFETNYMGPVNLIKTALPQMRKQRSGHILTLCGISMCIYNLDTEGLADSVF
jgi:NAD(P)-dependent dehydrogenase (short-subunit alcohol dehydrogenase family)